MPPTPPSQALVTLLNTIVGILTFVLTIPGIAGTTIALVITLVIAVISAYLGFFVAPKVAATLKSMAARIASLEVRFPR